ncbi:hypothetical protein [Dysgonomonas gadei]|uniref:hypothetical protein n=1 Tax=Dysgonomonas gadei TaxID=156974 RepID=UPI003AF1B605
MSAYDQKEKCKYSYCRRGNLWAVYDNETGSKVDSFIEKEGARKKVYDLNGWVYKSSKNESP